MSISNYGIMISTARTNQPQRNNKKLAIANNHHCYPKRQPPVIKSVMFHSWNKQILSFFKYLFEREIEHKLGGRGWMHRGKKQQAPH